MKRVKVMLMSLVLFAVVGGALAFKAKFDRRYCTTTPRNDNGTLVCTDEFGATLTCPQGVINSTTTTVGGTGVIAACTTTTVVGANPCPNTVTCPNITSIKKD